MKKILITGGCGFVGSNLAIQIKEKYKDYKVICLDNLKRRGSEMNISRLRERDINFVHGDIRNIEDFEELPDDINTIIDASAEPSVLAGLSSTPNYLIHTNYNGTLNCLNFAKKCGADFVFLSTSRIYPIPYLHRIKFWEGENRFELSDNQDIEGISTSGISENFPIHGHRSLYGASKLGSELLIAEYNAYMNLSTVINRFGVITGPYQMGKIDQGVIVLWAAKHFWKKELKYLGFGGSGKQVRDVLHIDDVFRLIDFQIHNMDSVNGKTMNAGGGVEVSTSLKELTTLCEEIIGNKISISSVSDTRQADIPIYISDNNYLEEISGWKPEKGMEQIVNDIFIWLKENEASLRPLLS